MATNKDPLPQERNGNENTSKDNAGMAEILARLQQLSSELDHVKKENTLLMKAADKHKIQRYTDREDFEKTKLIRVRVFQIHDEKGGAEKKLVVGWHMTRDTVTAKTAYDNDQQTCRVYLHDGTHKDMTFYEFAIVNDEKIEVPVTKTVQEKGKTLYYFIYNGEEHAIEQTFIN